MDVRCSRCGTEYEFDDALISERGTTVKCTNCGFQFKLFPGVGKGVAPERWVVRTASGRELVYTSLRELQRGIADKKVSATDLLSRGKQPPRALASIAELEPLFQAAPTAGKPRAPERMQHTLQGVAPPANSKAIKAPAVPEAPPAAAAMPVTVAPVAAAVAPPEAPKSAALTRPPPSTRPADFGPRTTLPDGSGAVVLSTETPATSVTSQTSPERLPESSRSSLPLTPRAPSSSRLSAFDSTLDVPTGLRAPVSSPRNLPPIEVESIRDSFKSYDELHSETAPDHGHARSARSRWIAGVVVLGVLGLLGSTVGRRYLSRLTGTSDVKASSDARVAGFLSDGNRLLADGDFEGAKEQFDKATALADKDPAVLTALARLETRRADVWWLRLRLIDPNSSDLVQATYRELGRRVGKARSAVDRAFAVSPEDPALLRARVDALRLSGEGDKAREWLTPLSVNASLPENAYVLAALDLAEPTPLWPSVIDRLRTAASAERDPGQARAALIYALSRAGRLSEAAAEFAKVDGRPKPHPLLEELRTFLQRAKNSLDDSPGAQLKIVTLDMSKLPKLDTSPAPEATGDSRSRLSQAAAALHQGDLSRAAQLYDSVVDEQPRNTEALSGLADIAEARHDSALAASLYERMLAENPVYLPALLASADQKWASGERASALTLYRRLLEQAGPSSEYGAHASARIAEADDNGEAVSGDAGSSKPEGASPPPPSVDSTDLPEPK